MSEDLDSSPVAVRVVIKKWLEGRFGKFAHAQVLSSNPPSPAAIYSPQKLKVWPELDVPFDCKIQLTDRWRVVELSEDAKPVEVELTGCVEFCSGVASKRSWRIRLVPGAHGAGYATLDVKTLRGAKFAHVDLGQELTFLALPSETDWVITKLLTPALSTVITDPETEYVAYALQDWSSDDISTAVQFAIKLPFSGVWPLVHVFCTLLEKQSILSLVSNNLDDPDSLRHAHEYIAHAQDVLREGSPPEIGNLRLGCLEVTLVWNARGYWNIKRLVAPLSMREPSPKETIDWVEGTVVSADQPIKSPSVDGDEEQSPDSSFVEEDSVRTDTSNAEFASAVMAPSEGPGKEPQKKKTQRLKVTVAIKDRRIGRGNVDGYLKPDEIINGRLTEGTKVAVRLIGNPPYWNVGRLHRSLPQRGEV